MTYPNGKYGYELSMKNIGVETFVAFTIACNHSRDEADRKRKCAINSSSL